ncbi:MAG: hypothetical protein Q8Q54_08895 [Methylococcales bacterium]|nr:hypothetical protein [Methylococcales bacterium]MDP3839022.1 hypothetical protein [Methylococcales bacterium]
MTIDILSAVLGWATVINIGIVTLWFLLIVYAHDWIYQLHSRWFTLSVERFDTIHYAGMAFYKISIYLFNLVPFLALQIVV